MLICRGSRAPLQHRQSANPPDSMAVGRWPSPHAEIASPAGDSPDLQIYLDIVRRGAPLILGGLLLGLLAGFLYAWTRPPVYEATATLLVARSKIGSDMSPPAATQAFRAFVVNKGIAAKVLTEAGLDRPPASLDPITFINNHLSVEEIVAGDLVRVHVRLPDAALAARVANRLVQLATDLNRRVNVEESLAVRDFIKAQLDESQTRLRNLERDLVAYKREAQLELRRAEVTSLLDQRGQLLELSVQLEGERASLRQAEQELAARPRVLPAPRAPNTVAALSPEALQPPAPPRNAASATLPADSAKPPGSSSPAPIASGGVAAASPTGPTTTAPLPSPVAPAAADSARLAAEGQAWLSHAYSSPLIDPVYELLEYRVTTGRARVADLERRRRLLIDQYKLATPTLTQLTDLYAREIAQARMQADYDLSAQVYADLFTRYEQARIQVASRSTELRVLDPAIEQPSSIAPSPLMASVLGAMAGAGIGTIIVFAAAFVRRSAAA